MSTTLQQSQNQFSDGDTVAEAVVHFKLEPPKNVSTVNQSSRGCDLLFVVALRFVVQAQGAIPEVPDATTPAKMDQKALVMAVDEASVVALYVAALAIAGVVMTVQALLLPVVAAAGR
ncbi:hypothetical protein JG687_00010532 [Phytophthora cactorum]|uniref:Uncharacterized protein n=1 Tax=Phytophthora cactorum TaxID=29920 RepID=A0A8T1UBP1_9STRA|nr:hypothetical protein JG687_00010532 [Phytophthora cactorum]